MGPGVGPVTALGLLGMGVVEDRAGRAPHPALGDPQGRPRHGISSLGVGLQMFRLSAKLTFPFGSNFYLSLSF